MSLILYISSQTYTSGHIGVGHRLFNNLLHIPIYGLLAYFILKCFSKLSIKTYAISFLIATFFGIFNELYQSTVPGRIGSFIDVCLNTVGIISVLSLRVAAELALPN